MFLADTSRALSCTPATPVVYIVQDLQRGGRSDTVRRRWMQEMRVRGGGEGGVGVEIVNAPAKNWGVRASITDSDLATCPWKGYVGAKSADGVRRVGRTWGGAAQEDIVVLELRQRFARGASATGNLSGTRGREGSGLVGGQMQMEAVSTECTKLGRGREGAACGGQPHGKVHVMCTQRLKKANCPSSPKPGETGKAI
ncbi:hypothetical protein C8R44DRAFT_746462 [Mycena epipterygia]|nr:hypothetical protein C8R44DRAFT_746462 [Mycena epipterygia]